MREAICDCCDGMRYTECTGAVCPGVCPVTSGQGGECSACEGSGVVPCEHCTEGLICECCLEPVHIRTVEIGNPGSLVWKAYGCGFCDWVRTVVPEREED